MSDESKAAEDRVQLVTTVLDWSDLVLDEIVRNDVEDIARWIQHRDTLLKDWNLAGRVTPGYRSLFLGPPGTGKKLAALLIGKTAGCDVCRVDLARIISEHSGETERNLDALIAQAQTHNWILLFDAADALLGDAANDRAANQQIAYLLQRLEDSPVVVIVTSNLAQLSDEVFARRFQSVIRFRMPNADERERLWRDALARVPKADDLDLKKLARDYALSGGDIVAALRMACLLALRRDPQTVTMADLEAAVKRRPSAKEH
jgi:SpoVK/Ycf46/Vps4 family AAA+-type ATPase